MFEVLEKAVDRCLKGSRIQQLNEIFISALFLDFELKKKQYQPNVLYLFILCTLAAACVICMCVCVCVSWLILRYQQFMD